MSDAQAKGVVLVFIDDDGRTIRSVSDFEQSGYGGFTLYQAQKMRAMDALAWAVIDAYASEKLSRVFKERHDARAILRKLTDYHGCRIEEIAVGHDAEKSA